MDSCASKLSITAFLKLFTGDFSIPDDVDYHQYLNDLGFIFEEGVADFSNYDYDHFMLTSYSFNLDPLPEDVNNTVIEEEEVTAKKADEVSTVKSTSVVNPKTLDINISSLIAIAGMLIGIIAISFRKLKKVR